MNLARVIGTVHATVKDPNLHRAKMLVLVTIDAEMKVHGLPFVAVDMVGAGVGEIVYYTTAYEAVMPWRARHPEVPMALIDAGVVGIVNAIDHTLPGRAGR